MNSTQVSGHLYGPAAPHIAFYYGDTYISETRGTADDVEGAKARIARQIRICENAEDCSRKLGMLENYTETKIICGSTVTPIRSPATSAQLMRRLEEAGFGLDRRDDIGVKFVLMLVHDPLRDLVVGLLKERGPDFLIGKLTFPGGKTEPGETPEEAATREMKEEAGLSVPVDAWKFVCRSSVVMVLATISADVVDAHQCDDEPIFVMSVPRQLEYAARTPDAYVPDFSVLLEATLVTLG
jgi:8-oxo-dGTP pyrophosphatase MutT (NUDIX family)